MATTEKLSELFLELIVDEKHSAFVANLLATKAGAWTAMRDLCLNMPPGLAKMRGMDFQSSEPVVTWIEDPFANSRAGYCILLSYWEEDFFTQAALFNKADFERRRDLNRSSMTLLK